MAVGQLTDFSAHIRHDHLRTCYLPCERRTIDASASLKHQDRCEPRSRLLSDELKLVEFSFPIVETSTGYRVYLRSIRVRNVKGGAHDLNPPRRLYSTLTFPPRSFSTDLAVSQDLFLMPILVRLLLLRLLAPALLPTTPRRATDSRLA